MGMTPGRPAVYCLTLTAMLIFSLPSYAQRKRTVDTSVLSRWELSFNPFGLLEPKAAVGVGVGFVLNRHWGLWSETSRLQHLFINPESSSGIRQILQLKYFVHGLPDIFFAAEVRYKGYQYTHTVDLHNATTDEYQRHQLTEHQRFLGTALQFGFRRSIKKSIGLYMEFVIGAGYRHIVYDHQTGAPQGFYRTAKDIDLGDVVENTGIYYPGSIRLVWMFGKKL